MRLATRQSIAWSAAIAVHALLFVFFSGIDDQRPPPVTRVEVSVVPAPPVATEEPAGNAAEAAQLVPSVPVVASDAKRRRAAASGVVTPSATPGEVAAPAAGDEGEQGEATGTGAPGGQGEGGGNGTGTGTGTAAVPTGSGPVPLADYSRVDVGLPADLMGKFAGRELAVDLVIDEGGVVRDVVVLTGVDGRVDDAVADVIRDFRFHAARDAAGAPTIGVVTWKFTVRKGSGGRRRVPLTPLLASAGWGGIGTGARGLPEPDPAGQVDVAGVEPAGDARFAALTGRGLARGMGGSLFGAMAAVDSSTRGRSGVPADKRVAQLAPPERKRLCAWAIAQRGGAEHASNCRYVEDRSMDDAAGRWKWYEGSKSQDGTSTYRPWWWGNGSVDDDRFSRGVVDERQRSQSGVTPEQRSERGLENAVPSRIIYTRAPTGPRAGKMEGPERMSVVETEAACVEGLEVYEVCTVTVQDLEACAAAMAEDPCTGHEKAACTKVSRCGAPVAR